MPDAQPNSATIRDASPASAGSSSATPGRAETTPGRAGIAALADELLPALIARLSASSIGELEVQEGSWRIRLRRSPAQAELAADGEPVGRARPMRGGHPPGTAADGTDAAATTGAAPAAFPASGRPSSGTQRDGTRLSATSPAVGYFAPRDGTGVGQKVRSGDVLGHIDVLGVRQEVVSPADGIVARLLAEAGEAVEYGQELVRFERPAREARPAPAADVAPR